MFSEHTAHTAGFHVRQHWQMFWKAPHLTSIRNRLIQTYLIKKQIHPYWSVHMILYIGAASLA